MAEWIGSAPTQRESHLETEVVPPSREESESNLTSMIETYAVALSRTPEEITAEFQNGYGPSIRYDAQRVLRANADEQQRVDFDSILEEENTEEAFRRMEEFQQTDYHTAGQTTGAPDIALLLSNNPEFAAIDARIASRQTVANRLIQERMDRAGSTRVDVSPELSGLEIAGYWLDMMASEGVHSGLGLLGTDLFEGAGQLNELALEANQLMYLDIPDAEFATRLDEILDRVGDAGFFSEDNAIYLSAFLENMEQAGVGQEATANRAFQGLDIALGGIGVAETAIHLGRRVGQTPRNIARLTDQETGTAVVVRQGDALEDTDMVAEGTSTSVVAPARVDSELFSGPEMRAMRELEANNTVLDIIKNGNYGQMVTPEVLADAVPRILTRTRAALQRVNRPVMDYNVETGNTGNVFGVGYIGRTDGLPFRTEVSAQRVADSIGGEVVQQAQKQYVVRKAIDIPTSELADALDIRQVNTSWVSNIVSTTSRQPASLDAMLKRGEAQAVNALKDITRLYRRSRKQVSRSERTAIDEVLRQLRDDPLHNWRKEAISDAEFRQQYNRIHGTQPTDKQVAHHKSIRDLNDTQYFIDADLMLKQAINNNETMVRLNGEYFRARKVTVEDDMTVYNTDTKTLQKGSDLDPERAVVYEVKNADFEVPQLGRVQYVTGSDLTTRRMFHTDVLGYNTGGPRTYRNTYRFFMKQDESNVKLAGGDTLKGQPSTFMGVRTQEEAAKVADQWNTIARAIDGGADEAEVNRLIRENNEWNPSIEDIDDLRAFATEHGLDIKKPITFAGDGEPVVGTPFAGEETVGGAFQGGLTRSKTRGQSPLVGYGGEPLEALHPSQAIERSFAASVGRRADQRYTHNAVNSWVKAADQLGLIPQELRGKSPKTIMNAVEVSSHTAEGKALAAQRNTINYRISATSRNQADQETLLHRMADTVYGAGYTRAAKPLDVLARTDIAGFLRAMAFHTKLGLFNPDQIMVQASQLINVMGTGLATLNPVTLARTSAGIPAMRLALVNDLSPAGVRRIAELQSPITGLSPDDFVQLREWIKSTGRSVVNRTAVEDNNSYAGLVGSRTLDYGQVFFNEGETIARIGAAMVNFAERRRRYPNEDIFSDAVTDAMIHRQDVLTASMTSASAAPWQKSLAAVPLQFVTYQVRMMEQLFMSQSLKPMERFTLGLTHLTTYGAAAVPVAGFVMDRLGYEGTVDPNSEYYDLVRYGTLDAILSSLSDSETALSSRLAVGEGSFDFVRGLVEEGLLETLAGPGGIITLGTGRDFVKMVGNMFGGSGFNYIEYDWNRFARNISSYERGYATWMAARHGLAISRRTEEIMFEDLSSSDAVMSGLGIPLQERELAWASIGNMMMDDAMLERTVKEAERLDNIARRLLDEGDTDGAAQVAGDIGAILFVLPLNEREEVLNRLRYTSTLPEGLIRQLIQRGQLEIAEKLEASIE